MYESHQADWGTYCSTLTGINLTATMNRYDSNGVVFSTLKMCVAAMHKAVIGVHMSSVRQFRFHEMLMAT